MTIARPVLIAAAAALACIAVVLPLLFIGLGSERTADERRTIPRPDETQVVKVAPEVATTDAARPRTGDGDTKAPVDGTGTLERVSAAVVLLSTDKGSMGSGFLVSHGDTVATSFHVVEGAKAVTATFNDGKTIDVIGFLRASPEHDLVLLRLGQQSEATPLTIADSDCGLGSDVYAVGMPKGLTFSVSKGVLSGYRTWPEVENVLKSDLGDEVEFDIDLDSRWIQTTTPISPGNSGGPLVTETGEVIGVNTLRSISRSSQNINFAIDRCHIASLIDAAGHDTIPLAKLPARGQRENRDGTAESLPKGTAFDQHEIDRMAWDYAAVTVGRYVLDISIVAAEMEKKQTSGRGDIDSDTLARQFARGVGASSLLAMEKLRRIDPKDPSEILSGYIDTLVERFSEMSDQAFAIANAPRGTDVTGRPIEMDKLLTVVDAMSPAVKSRLEWIHGKRFFGARGFAEEDLPRWERLREHRLASAKKDGDDLRALDDIDCNYLWDTYQRATSMGGGMDTLRAIIRHFPNTEDGRRARKMLQEREKASSQ